MDVAGISRPALLAMIAVAVALFAGGVAWAASWLTRLDARTSSGDVHVEPSA
jgi:hypothetical protein